MSALSASAGQPERGRGMRYEVTGEDEDSSRSGESDHVRDLLAVVISFPERLYGLRSAPAPQTRVPGAGSGVSDPVTAEALVVDPGISRCSGLCAEQWSAAVREVYRRVVIRSEVIVRSRAGLRCLPRRLARRISSFAYNRSCMRSNPGGPASGR